MTSSVLSARIADNSYPDKKMLLLPLSVQTWRLESGTQTRVALSPIYSDFRLDLDNKKA